MNTTPATPADLDAAASVLASAFAAEPQVSALLGSRATGPDRLRRMRHLFRALLASGPLQEGTVDVARDPDDGSLLGVALWVAPRGRRGSGALRPLRSLAALPDHLRAFAGTDLHRPLRALRAFERARPRVPHWYLEAVGVAPAGHGRGTGSALLQHRLALADAASEPAYLESSSPRTSALYRRLGFVPLGAVRAFPDGSGPMAMWRPARASAAPGGR